MRVLLARGTVWFALVLGLLLSGCGLFQRGGGGYSLSLNPPEVTVEQGDQAEVAVTLRRQGFAGPVTLSLEGDEVLSTSPAADKVAWTFNPNPASGDISTLRLQVGANVPTREYTFTVRGQAQGQGDQTARLVLRVQEAQVNVQWLWEGTAVSLKVFSGNGNSLLVAGGWTRDGKPAVWISGRGLRVLSQQSGAVDGVCISDDGQRIGAVGYLNGTQDSFWWQEGWDEVQVLPTPYRSGNVAYACAWIDGQMHVVGRTLVDFPYAIYWIDGRTELMTKNFGGRGHSYAIYTDLNRLGRAVVSADWRLYLVSDPRQGNQVTQFHSAISGTIYWARISETDWVAWADGNRGFLWTQEEKIELPGPAYGISEDGSKVVGRLPGGGAYIWDVFSRSTQNLSTMLAPYLASGESIENAYGVSSDGRYVLGNGKKDGVDYVYLLEFR